MILDVKIFWTFLKTFKKTIKCLQCFYKLLLKILVKYYIYLIKYKY